MSEQVVGKVVVLTGASSGFGRGAALKLAAGGAKLVLAARRGELLDNLVEECISAGGRAIAVPTDVSQKEDMSRLAAVALEIYGHIDVWINDAGAGVVGPFTEVPVEEHVQVIQTDLIGTIYGSHLALTHFKTRGKGTLINIASIVGKVPAPYMSTYSGAKHGVVGFSAALRQELAEQKEETIHVCTVMPMAMNTPFFEHSANYGGREAVPVPPMDEAERVVDAIVDLVTNPKGEVPVGKGSLTNIVMHNFAPAASEKIMGALTQKTQGEGAPPAADDGGGLSKPDKLGTELHDPKLRKAQP